MSTPKSLWGELPAIKVVRTPAAILREQATQLTELTNGLLEGDVATSKWAQDKPFGLTLSIVAPSLDGYRFSVVRVYHDILLYPAKITDFASGKTYEAQDEEQFVEAVEKVLSSPAVHKTISALLSQSVSEESIDNA